MKKATLIIIMALVGLAVSAQTNEATFKYGFLSYEAALKAMPEYGQMQADMALLKSQYEDEQKRVEDDFNKKYEEFLDGQASYPRTILQKRQSELQEILDKNIAFKKESEKLLSRAQYDAIAPLKQKLDEILRKIGEERGFAFILNTDNNNAPWLNPAMGEDITEAVKALLK